MFNSLSDRLAGTFKNLRGKGRLSDTDLDTTLREIRVALLEADVALPAVRTFTTQVRERAKSVEVSQALNPTQQVVKIVHEELIQILGGSTRTLRFAKNPPTVIMLVGLQGSGKTTLAGKLAHHLKEQGHRPLLVAADLQRPNAVDQLNIVAQRADVNIHSPQPGNGVGDPVAVARSGVKTAQEEGYDIVIVDTAGRLTVDTDMMAEAVKIKNATNPDEVLLVIDAMIGQDAVTTAESFNTQIGCDAVVLTKLDGDARGGAALSVREVTGKPIIFASTGEKLEDFEVFHPDRVASRILNMGDMLTLIEKAEKAFDAKQLANINDKLTAGENFTLEDFLQQMHTVRKMGSLGKLAGMLPGMGDVRKQLQNIDERDINRVTAIIQSMTPQERHDSTILNGSRRLRIANGAGVHVSEVNSLLERFKQSQKMMQNMFNKQLGAHSNRVSKPNRGKTPTRKTQKNRGKKGRSGNPAKRAAQENAARKYG